MRIRRRSPGTFLRTAALIGIVAGALGAPATVASAAGSGCRGGAAGAVQAAYADVFSRSTELPIEQRLARLDHGDDPAVRAILEQWLASPVSAGTTVSALTVRCTARDRAVVDAVLVLAGEDLPDVLPPGRAVRRAGTWTVALSTFCDRMVLEDPSLADAGACSG